MKACVHTYAAEYEENAQASSVGHFLSRNALPAYIKLTVMMYDTVSHRQHLKKFCGAPLNFPFDRTATGNISEAGEAVLVSRIPY